MRGLLTLVVVMGLLIVAGLAVIGVTIVHRFGAPILRPAPPSIAVLDQPLGTLIAGAAGLGDRLAVTLHGGGPDRLVILDAHSLALVGTVKLAR